MIQGEQKKRDQFFNLIIFTLKKDLLNLIIFMTKTNNNILIFCFSTIFFDHKLHSIFHCVYRAFNDFIIYFTPFFFWWFFLSLLLFWISFWDSKKYATFMDVIILQSSQSKSPNIIFTMYDFVFCNIWISNHHYVQVKV